MRYFKRMRPLAPAVTLFFLLFLFFLPLEVQSKLEDNIRILKGREQSYDVSFPLSLYIKADRDGVLNINGSTVEALRFNRLGTNEHFTLEGLQKGSVDLEISLFNGLIPLRQISVNVLPELELMVGGHSIGIKLHAEGVIVVGYYYLNTSQGPVSPAQESGILLSDVILSVNEKKIKNIDHAANLLKYEALKGPVSLEIKRGDETFTFKVSPFRCPETGEMLAGLYIRDTSAGVGTLTFYNSKNQLYGALGHVITDLDTRAEVEINDGLIVNADIINIKMAQKGQPGEKAGIFREGNDILGTIKKNTTFGIYGELKQIKEKAPLSGPLPLALAFQVETGAAEMLTVVDGNQIERYCIEIERTVNQDRPGDKGIILRVVDEDLLDITGGIVQGMSGSPIIQDGRLVGAVTHVFVNDPRRGYGIFAEWMAKEVGLIPTY